MFLSQQRFCNNPVRGSFTYCSATTYNTRNPLICVILSRQYFAKQKIAYEGSRCSRFFVAEAPPE